MRSKSVENFFQRSYSDARLPPDFITDPPPPSPPLLPGSPLVGDRSPSISPSLSPNPSISPHSPSLSLSPSLPAKPPRPQINHSFQDHVFRKPTNCQHCKHMIVGKVVNPLCGFSLLYLAADFRGFLACLSLFMWHPINWRTFHRENITYCALKFLYRNNVLSPQQDIGAYSSWKTQCVRFAETYWHELNIIFK